MLADLTATYRFDLANGAPASWLVSFRNGEVRVSPGGGAADCVVAAERQLFDGLASGAVNPMAAFLRGELAVSGDPGLLVRMLRLLERLQDTLGAHQDAVTQIARLRELADTASLPPATLLAMGALIRVLGRRARRRRRRFPALWRRFDRATLRRGVLEELSRHKRAARVLRLVRATGT